MLKLGLIAFCFPLAAGPVEAQQALTRPLAYSFKAIGPAATASTGGLPDPSRQGADAPVRLGPITFSGNPVDGQNRSGLQVRAAIPMTPRLDLVLDAYGSHDSVRAGNAVAAAAVTVGFRLKF